MRNGSGRKEREQESDTIGVRPDLLDETLAFWQPRADRELTREDARQIVENISGFFTTLDRWREEQESKAPQVEPDLAA